jgi:hypothetical protein
VGRDASDEKRLSPADLVIASVSSAAAAVIVHALWKPGTVIAAALTPILMSLLAEALRRPAELVRVRTGSSDGGRATVEVHRSRPRWGRAVVIGLAAFGLGAAGLTAAEAVLNRAFAERAGDTTLFDGERRPAPARTPDSPSPTAGPTPRDGAAAEPERRSVPPERSSPAPTPTPTPTVSPPMQPTPAPAAPTPQPRLELPDQVQQE